MAKAKKSNTSTKENSKNLEDFQGFKVLPVIMDENDKSIRHYFYMRKHESKSLVDENIKDRTLFLLNLPADTTDRHIKKLFKGHGIDQITYSDSGSSVSEDYWKITERHRLEQEKLNSNKSKKNKKKQEAEEEEEKPIRELRRLFTSGSSAHIVFSTEEDLTEVLDMRRVEKKWAKEDESTEQPLGLEST
jgi:ribosomal RNA-processing protein 7